MHLNDKYPTINLREYPAYTPHNTLGLTIKTAVACAGAGIITSAVKNSLESSKTAGFIHPKTGYYTLMFGKYWLFLDFGVAGIGVVVIILA